MKTLIRYILIIIFFIFGCQKSEVGKASESDTISSGKAASIATFAGGCFWCVESDFEKLPGVSKAISGYAGGTGSAPNYETYSSRGYVEAVQVYYDPEKISYERLLDYFWRHIDPTDPEGQFVDRGPQYRSMIFYHDNDQKQKAVKSKAALSSSGKFTRPIVTEITKFTNFFEAEAYHQDYYKKNPIRYRYYRNGSGRDQFLDSVWGKSGNERGTDLNSRYVRPDDSVIKKNLSEIQYDVTQRNGTEPPYRNEYWDNKKDGIYVDIVSGEPLFSSLDKYDSKTGWPSFTKPLEPANIIEKEDNTLFTVRTEVRSRYGDSHLGHVFPDGPKPTGLRYCMNSAAMRFIPSENLVKNGYGEYVKLFSSGK